MCSPISGVFDNFAGSLQNLLLFLKINAVAVYLVTWIRAACKFYIITLRTYHYAIISLAIGNMRVDRSGIFNTNTAEPGNIASSTLHLQAYLNNSAEAHLIAARYLQAVNGIRLIPFLLIL